MPDDSAFRSEMNAELQMADGDAACGPFDAHNLA